MVSSLGKQGSELCAYAGSRLRADFGSDEVFGGYGGTKVPVLALVTTRIIQWRTTDALYLIESDRRPFNGRLKGNSDPAETQDKMRSVRDQLCSV